MPDLPGRCFGLYDTILGFDLEHKALVYLGPSDRLSVVEAWLHEPPPLPSVPKFTWNEETSVAVYQERHDRLRAYIAAGDICQANLTLRFTAIRPSGLGIAGLHSALRRLSPAPFGPCFQAQTFGLTCASPKRFLRLTLDGAVETRPIKGTSARQSAPENDAAAAIAPQSNLKERPENLMITDVMRNDLGKVCKIRSMRVPELWAVESCAQAHHLVSAMTGQLRTTLDAFDLLAATLPGSSINRAPKRRAV
jgi:para-aminobenzoate synthetase component 1